MRQYRGADQSAARSDNHAESRRRECRSYRRHAARRDHHFQIAQTLLTEFTNQRNDYTIRVERPVLSIYTNSASWFDLLVNKITDIDEVWLPSEKSKKLLEENIILVEEEPVYQYKVSVGSQVSSSMYEWFTTNPDKVKAGPKFLETIKNKGYTAGFYFYCRDEKVLRLVELVLGGEIKRVDKFIVK